MEPVHSRAAPLARGREHVFLSFGAQGFFSSSLYRLSNRGEVRSSQSETTSESGRHASCATVIPHLQVLTRTSNAEVISSAVKSDIGCTLATTLRNGNVTKGLSRNVTSVHVSALYLTVNFLLSCEKTDNVGGSSAGEQ